MSDSATPWTVAYTRLLHPWDFPGKSTRVGCHFLLQGIFPTQGSNPRSPALQAAALPSGLPGKIAIHKAGQINAVCCSVSKRASQ